MPIGIGRSKSKDSGHDVGKGKTVEVIKISDSAKALLIRMPDKDEVWFPFSQMHPDSDICESNWAPEYVGHLQVTTWIAEQKGLLDDDDGDGFGDDKGSF